MGLRAGSVRGLVVGLVLLGAVLPVVAQESSHVIATADDGVAVHGETYFGGLDATAPLVLLFHQGGSNGRGEYAEIVSWLNNSGVRAVAWDQRSGGDTWGSENRTALGLAPSVPNDFCSAYADLEAALDHAGSHGLAQRVIVWGSSYSGALVFRLASEHPDRVAAVIAMSPASGGPMADCRARDWLEGVHVPAYVLRPASEMNRDSSIEQRDLFLTAGVEFQVVPDGVHGASMLVDSRTGHDMGAVRADVIRWLRAIEGR